MHLSTKMLDGIMEDLIPLRNSLLLFLLVSLFVHLIQSSIRQVQE